MPASRQRQILTLLLLGAVFIGAGIGLRDPWPSDEPRFAMIARDMVDSGQWFFPRRGGELYPDKPPLFMWAQAAFYQLTGSLRFAFLLPSLLAGLGTLLLVHDAGRRLWNGRVGFIAALFLLLTPQFTLEARAGQIDALVTFWIALGVYGLIRHLLLGPQVRWLYGAFFSSGLGIITKGVGFLPLLAFLPWSWARRRGAAADRERGRIWPHALLGPMCMLAAVALWLVPMLWWVSQSADPAFEAYRDNILFKQTGERYVDPSHHFKPGWYFLGNVMPSLWLPWFLLLPWMIPAWWRRIRRGDARYTMLLGWVALVILFFSLSPAKRGVYILPALPWACLAAAPLLSGLFRRSAVRRLTLAVPMVAATAAIAAWGYLRWIRPDKAAAFVERYEVNAAPGLLAVGVAITLVVLVFRRRPVVAYGAMMATLWLAIGFWLGPAANDLKSGRSLMRQVEAALPPNAPLALVDWKEQTLLQIQRPAENFGFLVPLEDQARAAVNWLAAHPGGWLLVQGRAMSPCFDTERSQLAGHAHRRDWYLVDAGAVLPACEAPQ